MLDHQFAIDSAPGKGLIDVVCHDRSTDALSRYFAIRSNWAGGYPLIHDRFVTYGAFDDLTGSLSGDDRYDLLPAVLELAETVPDQLFHSALFLLADMVPDDAIRNRPSGFSDALLRIRLRVEKLSFLPNLTCAWDRLARKQRCLKDDNDFLRHYSPASLEVKNGWGKFFPFPLRNLSPKNAFANNPLPMHRVREYFNAMGVVAGQRILVMATQIEKSRYWVWRILGKAGTAELSKIVFIRVGEDQQTGVGGWSIYRQFSERATPDDISRRLMKIEFYRHDLPDLDSAIEQACIESREDQSDFDALGGG